MLLNSCEYRLNRVQSLTLNVMEVIIRVSVQLPILGVEQSLGAALHVASAPNEVSL